MPDQLANRRALRALLADATGARLLRGRLVFVHPDPPCHGLACNCSCPMCSGQRALIREHRKAGRRPFTEDGMVRARPEKRQPWDVAA